MAKSKKGLKGLAAGGVSPVPLPKVYPTLQIGFSQQLARGTPAPHLEVTAAGGSFDRSYSWTVFIGSKIFELGSSTVTDVPEKRDESSDAKLVLRVFPSSDEKLNPGTIGGVTYADVRMLTITGTLIDAKKDPGKPQNVAYLSQPLKDRVV